jgi:branched-chain amino acid transport system substrate-binding protein
MMKKQNKTYLTIGIVVILIAAIIMLSTPKVEDTIKIGYIGPLTGGAAILGIEASQAVSLAVEQIIEDDQYETAKAVTAYNKLVDQDGVETIIMSTYGGVFAVAESAKQDNVLIVDSLDCDDDLAGLPENVFCIAKETKDLADVIADYAISQGFQDIGVLHSTTDNFMPSVALLFKDRVGANADVQIESYTSGTTDFRTSLLKLKEKDAVVFLGYQEIGVAIKQAGDLGLNQPMLSIPSVATDPAIQEASNGKIDGMYFSFYAPLEENQAAAKFYSGYESKFGRKPIVYVATDHAYDSAMILMEKVLPNVDGATKSARVQQQIQAMTDVKDYPGVSGTLDIEPEGRVSGIYIRLFKLENLAPQYVSG